MIKNIYNYKKVWILLGLLSLIISAYSVFNYNIYSQVISEEILPGTISQDIITIIAGLTLIYIGLSVNVTSYKKQILALSLVSYLFYGYGIYVIEQIYSQFYLAYMIVFMLSFWSIIFCIKDLNHNFISKITLPKILKRISLFFSIFIPILFYFLWTSDLLSLINEGTKLEFTFSVYILDMIFIMPAFLIIAYLISKKQKAAFVLAPIIFFKSFTLLFSVGIGSFTKLFLNSTTNFQEGFLYIALSLLFLGVSIAIINKIDYQYD